MYKKFIKRCFDIICAVLAITVLSPVIIILAICVRWKLGSPILFSQIRVGKDNKLIKIYKFRTMTDARGADGELLSDGERVTPFGRMLRSTSLDELPELFNILRGDMSVVGPRALLPEYLPYYTDNEIRRHLVRPGFTPPEVLYDNYTPTWEEQFTYEVEYVDNLSLWLDIKIILATVVGVFKRNNMNYGAYSRRSLVEERQKILKEVEL